MPERRQPVDDAGAADAAAVVGTMLGQTAQCEPVDAVAAEMRRTRDATTNPVPPRTPLADLAAFPHLAPNRALRGAGFRFGDRGTQSSRNTMLGELSELLGALPPDARREDYVDAVVAENVLGKPTLAARRSTRQRLSELYGLDPSLAVFRTLRRLWDADPPGRRLLATLCALARDPLLRSTAPPVLALAEGEGLDRAAFTAHLRDATGARFNDAVLAKVAKNAASSWRLSGHLAGSTGRWTRRAVRPTFGAAAFALWLGQAEGLAGLPLLACRWALALDSPGGAMLQWVKEAGRRGLIHVRAAGDVVEIDTAKLDPYAP